MKLKSLNHSQQHADSFETPKKKISSSVDSSSKRCTEDSLHTPKNRRRSSTKKSQRKRSPSESDEEKIDMKTEENIQQVALKNNLSEEAVKKILKKVVGNDHVLAIVKLKEEEMERKNQAELEDVDADDDDDVEHMQKITRSKAKVLNKKILPITSPSEPSEASILIHEELGSDDEDEEYEPGNDEVHSDDDHNSSVSDMDSQPRTPKTPYTAEEDTPTKYTNDGLFKIPRDRNDSSTSQNDNDYIIAKRTRSKVSLATTAIETIESTFQPPDTSPDMYDKANELDTDWLEFLNVLTKPINQTVEDDDETDPEYIAADQIPIDKEELREVNISKKELNDLVDELFSNLSDVDFDEINKYDNIPELFRTKEKVNRSDNTDVLNKSDSQSDQDISFQPSEISTPVTSKEKSIHNNRSSRITEDNSMISVLSNFTLNQSSLSDATNQTQTLVPINTVNPLQGSSVVNGVLRLSQYQQVLVQIPTIDILKIQAQHQQLQNQQSADTPSQLNFQFIDERPKTRPSSLYQLSLFQHLKCDLPTTVQFNDEVEGFTCHQRDILNQQLRIHVQFAAQNFLQLYGNPGKNLWKNAHKLKHFLTELDDITSGSSVNIENLKPALNVLNKWEADLYQPDTDENKEYAEFLLAEATKSQNATLQAKCSYIPKFSKRLMDVVVDSAAFPYPHLLPKIPFRMDLHDKFEFIPMEDYLIAHFLEIFYDEYHNERIRNNTESKVSLQRICSRICLRMCSFRKSATKNPVYRYVVRRKSKTEVYNPIQYFFQYYKAPPFNHKLYDFNSQQTLKDLPFHQFSKVWAEHVKQYKAIEDYKYRICRSKPVQKVLPRCKTVEPSNASSSSLETDAATKSQNQPIFIVKAKHDSTILNSVPIQYEIVEVNANTGLDLTKQNVVAASSAKLSGCDKRNSQFARKSDLTSDRNKEKRRLIETCVSRLHSKNAARQLEASNPIRKIVTKSLPNSRNDVTLLRKLSQIFCCSVENYFTLDSKIGNYKTLLPVHSSVRDFAIYMILVEFNLKMANVGKRPNKDGGEEAQDNVNPCSSAMATAAAKKNPKTQRIDNTRLMLLPETREDTNEKDVVYAQHFMDKVEEVYLAESKSEKVTEFLHLLQTFNPSTDKVEELYYKMEQLFLPDHPELVELFLTFLLPGHAAIVGKFMEHFMLTNMNNFINKLNIYFNKQPAQIRKIMTCLRDLSNEDDLKMEQVKLKIFPLLKGNPLLIEWFKQCFSDDTTWDNPADEYESLSFHKAENTHQTDDESDVYENIQQSEIVADPVENPCLIRYLNGRMYYGSSRVLLPAKLSFAVVTASDQNAINEVAKCEVTQRPKESIGENESEYRCVHSIKQFGDNKIKECPKNQLETFDNSAIEDMDNEKSIEEQNCNDATDDTDIQLSESCVQGDEKTLSSTESQEIVYNTCDDLTLKAHGIRLNSTVHQSNVIKSEDLLCLLDPVDDVAEKEADESLKTSPKRHSAKAHRKSPNSKKSNKRSPTHNRKSSSAANTTSEESNAIRTAKRLKRLIESDDIEGPERLTKKSKLSKQSKVADPTKIRKNKTSSCDGIPLIEIAKTEQNMKNEPSSSTLSVATNWSRDEDKLVLEQIKMGFTNEENLVHTLHSEKLPNRTHSEIYDRFKFLMDVIANL